MMKRPNEDMVDDLFAQARKAVPVPTDDLVARVLADADLVQTGVAAAASPVTGPRGRQRIVARIFATLGGWPAVSGLAAATVAGVWVGITPPAGLAEMTASMMGDTISVPLVPSDLGFAMGDFADG